MSSKHGQQSSSITTQNQVVQWLNDCGLVEGHKRVELLRKITEVVLHGASHLVPVYTEHILSYVSDKSSDVKKQVVTYIEEISKLHPQYLPKVIGQLRMLVIDPVIAVQKRAIQAASIVYRNTLMWLCKVEADNVEMQHVWQHLTELKLIVLNMIDSENEGIRTHSIKFLEEVVLLQSPGSSNNNDEFSLHSLPPPPRLAFLDRRALQDESEHIFALLVKFHNSQHISSVNLMACMTTLCAVARARPRFLPRVARALADLHTTLPPTLSASQVNSVRKHLKMLLINLIKHPGATTAEMMPQLTQLLSDAGMTQQEINKAIPKERRNKRLGEIKNGDAPAKRFRVDSPQSNSQGSDSNSRSEFQLFDDDSNSNSQPTAPLPSTLPPTLPPTLTPSLPIPLTRIVTEESLLEGLDNVENVVRLVTSTLVNNLPAEMPENFVRAYKPIPNSGSKAQKKNLSKMILEVIEGEPLAPPFDPPLPPLPPPVEISTRIPLLREDDEKITLKNAVAKLQESTKADKKVENAVNRLMEETRQDHLKEEERKAKEKEKEKEKLIPPPTPTVPKLKQKVKLLKLQEITRPIPKEIKERLVIDSVKRILRAETESAIGGASAVRAKFLSIFASSYTPVLRDLVLEHILEEPAQRLDLALSWLYEEYAFMQGFARHPATLQPRSHEKHDHSYNRLLCSLVTQLYERTGTDTGADGVRDALLRRIYSEAPLVTDEAVEYLKHLASEPRAATLALDLLEELCATRPPRAHKYAPSLLAHILSENDQSREQALAATVRLYKRGFNDTAYARLRASIEKHALLYLGFIALDAPPPELMAARARQPWSDHLYRICLSLVMELFPHTEEIIVEVARVYGCAGADAKRCVLRAIEPALRDSIQRHRTAEDPTALPPAAIALLEECPRGAETLLTRLVHMLTEKNPPTPDLVQRVRELYATRVSDVRFLIPVLPGLSKNEILAALPKLIKLNPAVVKEVFNKLLGLQNPGDDSPPVSPADLLVSLHLIDTTQADLKYIIKATALCFAEKHTYTQDVVSSVLQRLSEQEDVPVLMMRSVLQALTLYSGLQSLVLNILQLLVEKEVWNNKVAWEGWVKCCERLAPRSCFLLAALPARALHACSPALLAALRTHVAALSPAERALLPSHVAAVAAPTYQPEPVPPPVMPGPLEPLPPGME